MQPVLAIYPALNETYLLACNYLVLLRYCCTYFFQKPSSLEILYLNVKAMSDKFLSLQLTTNIDVYDILYRKRLGKYIQQLQFCLAGMKIKNHSKL